MNETLLLTGSHLCETQVQALWQRGTSAPVRSTKARLSFQPIDQLVTALDKAEPLQVCA